MQRAIENSSKSYLPTASVYSNESEYTSQYRDEIKKDSVTMDTDETLFRFLGVTEIDDVEDEDDNATHRAEDTQEKTALKTINKQ